MSASKDAAAGEQAPAADSPESRPAPAPQGGPGGEVWKPGTSLADENPDERADMPLSRRVRRALRAWIKYPLMRALFWLLPWLYLAYFRFVWATSRYVNRMEPMKEWRDEHDGICCALLHEEVLTVAYSYSDFYGHTLASVGDAGEAITRLLEKCNYTVFRGGSAASRSRRREVLPDMIEHMKTHRRVIYGLTTDGSKGPRYKMKRGIVAIAHACRRPVAVGRTWYKRYIRLPTWDRMAIPLPFNVIIREARGPYWPPESDDPLALEAFRKDIEHKLLVLTRDLYVELGKALPEELVAALAEHEPAK